MFNVQCSREQTVVMLTDQAKSVWLQRVESGADEGRYKREGERLEMRN